MNFRSFLLAIVFVNKLVGMGDDDLLPWGYPEIKDNYFASEEWLNFKRETESFLCYPPEEKQDLVSLDQFEQNKNSLYLGLKYCYEEKEDDSNIIAAQSKMFKFESIEQSQNERGKDEGVFSIVLDPQKKNNPDGASKEKKTLSSKRYYCFSCKESFFKKYKKPHELWHDCSLQNKCNDCKIAFNNKRSMTAHRTSNRCKVQRNKTCLAAEPLVQEPGKKKKINYLFKKDSSTQICHCGYTNSKMLVFEKHKTTKHDGNFICFFQNCRQIHSVVTTQYTENGLKISTSPGAHQQHLKKHKKRGDRLCGEQL